MILRNILLVLAALFLLGELAMARPPFLHQKKLDAFKHEIRYERVLEKLPPDKRVLLDWGPIVSEIKDAEGVTWRGKDPSVFAAGAMANLSVSLKSELGIVSMNVYSLRDGQKEAVEEALHYVASSSTDRVQREIYESCFADFCLAPRMAAGNRADRFDFVYGNIYIHLDCIEYLGDSTGIEGDVLPLARAFQSAMEKAVFANPEGRLPARPRISYTVTPTRIKVGETFIVTTSFAGGAKLDPRTFDVAQDLVSNNVEYEKDLGNSYKFAAKAAGIGTVAFSLLDKKTLWVFTDTVTVHIDPAK